MYKCNLDVSTGIILSQHLDFSNLETREQFFRADPRAINVVGAVIAFQVYKLGVSRPAFVVTSVERDWDDQDRLYGNNPKDDIRIQYRKHPFASVHMYRPCRAIDGVIPQSMIEDELTMGFLVNYVENCFPYGDNIHRSVLVHDVGFGLHVHCQVIQGEDNVLVEGKSRFAK